MIEVRNLTKTFDGFTAVNDVSFSIGTGEFFALLGPNGAGKTTTISMLSTLILPTAGHIYIDGEELSRSRQDIKRKVSVVTQEYSMRQDMDMDEVMEYQGRLYHVPRTQRRQRTEELFSFAGLTDHRWKSVRNLSGGMKRKLMVCRALLTEPQILILDEPTAGMDALARRQMWNLLRQLNEKGLTILLTTHYIEEAENLCDRVALINEARIQQIATPREFITELGEYAVDVMEEDGLHSDYFHAKQDALARMERADRRSTMRATSLEDVFVERIGRSLKNEADRKTGRR